MSTSELQAKYDEILKEIDALSRRLADLREQRDALEVEASGIKVGDIVRLTERRNGHEAIVRAVDTYGYTRLGVKPWLLVSLRKKNGEFSLSVIRAFTDWEPSA